ncbi:MAG TPA: 3-deoxy-7-phosphoheptulonate synthase class II, partial [Acidimicrobiaceae bacterium]|nr:3-deoxy-7-phosphoheptulonate synthase class II [Acidimicrobiaceae bacterium]
MRAATDWDPRSWRHHPAFQQPDWPDDAAHEAIIKEIGNLPPLVFAGEARDLTESLAAVSRGEAF